MKRFLVSIFLLSALPTAAAERVYFSPSGGCEENVINFLNGAQSSIDAAVYSVNNMNIIGALARAKDRGVKVRLLVDRTQASVNKTATQKIKTLGIDIRVHSVNKIQHNKFAVVDGKLVETGSFNWTSPAENKNEENCIFLDSSDTVASFAHRFSEHLWVVNTQAKSDEKLAKLLTGMNRSPAAMKGEP